MTRISVCMATYNGGHFLKRQLGSILEQLDTLDEIIISDDGSTDNTLLIISEFNDNRIKLFINKDRHGPIGNFENALQHATGEFVFLSDQDDMWLPDKVNSVLPLLLKNDLVLTDCEIVDQDDNLLQASFFNHRGVQQGFWRNIYRNSYIGCCMAFRRDVLSYVLPFPSTIHMHDWWIGLLVEIKGKIAFQKQPLIKYVRHGNNASPTGEAGYSFARQLSNRYLLLVNIAKRLLLQIR